MPVLMASQVEVRADGRYHVNSRLCGLWCGLVFALVSRARSSATYRIHERAPL